MILCFSISISNTPNEIATKVFQHYLRQLVELILIGTIVKLKSLTIFVTSASQRLLSHHVLV